MFALHRLAKNTSNARRTLSVTAHYCSSSNPKPNASPFPSSANYDDLINRAGRDRDFAAVRNLLSKRLTDGCYNTSRTFKFIAFDITALDDLLENLAAIEDWFTKKHAHDTLVAQLAGLNRTTEALRVAESMVAKKYGATPVTFHPIVSALARKKEMTAAWRVVEMMRACGVRPDLTSFNYILTAYCVIGDLTSAADVLVKMEEEGVGADARTYDALVLGACRAGKVEGALDVIRRMTEEDGMTVLYSSHDHVINEMVRSGYIAQALEFVRIFGGRDDRLDKDNFGFLARRLKMAKRIEEAKSVVEEMQNRGLSIDDELMDDLSCSSVSCKTE